MPVSRVLVIAITSAVMSAPASLIAAPAAELGERLQKIVVPTPAPQTQPQPPAQQPGLTRTSSPNTQATGPGRDRKDDHEEWKRERKKQHAEWKREHRHKHHHAHWKHDRSHARHDWKHHHHARGDWKHHGRPDFQRAKFERPERPDRHGHRR